MLLDMKVVPTLPVVDLERAREFYEKKLGLKVAQSDPGEVFFECGEGTILYIYQRAQTKADHTVAGFIVPDIEAETQILREKGIVFNEIDMPELKTVNGIATKVGGDKTAWFNDTEGNILALHQMSK